MRFRLETLSGVKVFAAGKESDSMPGRRLLADLTLYKSTSMQCGTARRPTMQRPRRRQQSVDGLRRILRPPRSRALARTARKISRENIIRSMAQTPAQLAILENTAGRNSLVRMRGLEPPRPLGHRSLNSITIFPAIASQSFMYTLYRRCLPCFTVFCSQSGPRDVPNLAEAEASVSGPRCRRDGTRVCSE
jgi:hypothetical protein